MHRSARLLSAGLAFAFALLCLLPQPASARRGPKESVPQDQAEAVKWAEEALASFKTSTVNDQFMLYSDGQNNFGIALARVTGIRFNDTRQYPLNNCVYWQDYAHDAPESICWAYRKAKQAERFEGALEFLSSVARRQVKAQYDAEWQKFQAQAADWRNAAVRPTMPEAAHEHQVLAEYAFKEKNTDKAIVEYKAALDIFPTWPEGQFNLATIAGERKYYEMAIQHMKEYLQLVPNAPDTQAAQDSIIIWRDKVSTLYPSAANAEPESGKPVIVNTSTKRK